MKEATASGRVPGILKKPLVGKLLRFAVVGGISGLAYAAVTLIAVRGFGMQATPASALGYVAVLPLSYAGHRGMTFKSKGRVTPEFIRFCVSFVLGMISTVAGMFVIADVLGLDPLLGIAFAILVVPAITFIILNFWVFEPGKGKV